MLPDFVVVEWPGGRHVALRQLAEQIFGRELLHGRGHLGSEFADVGDDLLHRVEALVGEQVEAIDRGHEPDLLRLGCGRHADAAVCGLAQVVEHLAERGVVVDIVVEQGLVHEPVHEDEVQACIHHGQVDVLAFARAFTHEQRRSDGLADRVGGHLVAHEAAHELGTGFFALPLDRSEAGLGLDDRVIGRRVGHRPLGAEAGHTAIDEARVDLAQLVGTEAEARHHAGPIVAEDHVGLRCELFDDGLALVALDVDTKRPLAPVAVREQRRDAALGRPEVTHRVTQFERLDLDDFGTLVGEHHRGERRRDHGRELHHSDSLEWLHASPFVCDGSSGRPQTRNGV